MHKYATKSKKFNQNYYKNKNIMAERGLPIRSGMPKQGWEMSDFPVVCQTCMGKNPYLRMMKSYFNKECKICFRPFTVFRWRAGTDERYKKTEICQTCAKAKNICQTCFLDLEFGLPTEVRDKFINNIPQLEIPKEEVNRNLWANELTKKIDTLALPYGKESTDEILDKIAKKEPELASKNIELCPFFPKGLCSRGKSCPLKHEILKREDIKDEKIEEIKKIEENPNENEENFVPVEDPFLQRILANIKERQNDNEIDDKNDITTLHISGINDKITEKDIKTTMGKFGKIRSVKCIYKNNCAFAEFISRESAELAMEGLKNNFFIKNIPLTVEWGKKRKRGPKELIEIKEKNQNKDNNLLKKYENIEESESEVEKNLEQIPIEKIEEKQPEVPTNQKQETDINKTEEPLEIKPPPPQCAPPPEAPKIAKKEIPIKPLQYKTLQKFLKH